MTWLNGRLIGENENGKMKVVPFIYEKLLPFSAYHKTGFVEYFPPIKCDAEV